METELLADIVRIQIKALVKIEARLRQESLSPAAVAGLPKVGSVESMLKVLEAFENTSQAAGKTQREASQIAKGAGMNPRGLAGYFRAGLLKGDKKANSRWITTAGKARLEQLRK